MLMTAVAKADSNTNFARSNEKHPQIIHFNLLSRTANGTAAFASILFASSIRPRRDGVSTLRASQNARPGMAYSAEVTPITDPGPHRHFCQRPHYPIQDHILPIQP